MVDFERFYCDVFRQRALFAHDVSLPVHHAVLAGPRRRCEFCNLSRLGGREGPLCMTTLDFPCIRPVAGP